MKRLVIKTEVPLKKKGVKRREKLTLSVFLPGCRTVVNKIVLAGDIENGLSEAQGKV